MVKIADGTDNSDPRRFGETRSKGGYPFLELQLVWFHERWQADARGLGDRAGAATANLRRLARIVAENGVVTREQLSAFSLGATTRRLIDQSRGIWNPRDMSATLAVVPSPDGPYADAEVEGGRFRYDYRAGSTGGDNTKLRAAYELQLPIILLPKIDNGVY